MHKTLIVEDNATFRQTILGILGSQFPNMTFEQATNGKEALQKLSECVPDLVFMDISLPGESGLNLVKEIRAGFPKTIIVILTSYDFPEYREIATQNGANHFLSKGSSTAEEILVLVGSLLSEPDSEVV